MPDSDDDASADGPDVPLDAGVERLIGLLWLFRHQGRVRTNDEIEERGYPDLTGEDSVGRKNFANDRERLRALGVDLQQTRDRQGWKVAGEPDPVWLVLTPEERDAITEARLLVADDDTNASSPGRPTTIPAAAPVALAAISDHRALTFKYGGRSRVADPYRVVVAPTDRWYLLAIDRQSGAPKERTFRLDRMTNTTVDRDHTTGPAPAGARWPLHPTAWQSDPEVTVTVRFPHEPLPEWLAILGPPQTKSTNDDGTAEATFAVSSYDAFVRRTLAIGAEIVGPHVLVELARSCLEAHNIAYGPL